VSGPAFAACAGAILRKSRGSAEAIAISPRLSGGPVRRPVSGERGPKAILRWLAESF
jgi:hypothetical protein